MNRVAVLQPTYWPRTHVFHRLFSVDTFIWLDTVQFARSATKWEDRTVVEDTRGHPITLRLPVKGTKFLPWLSVRVNDGWQKHLKTLTQSLSKTPYWSELNSAVTAVYSASATTINEVCWRTFQALCWHLSPTAKIVTASSLSHSAARKSDLVLTLVKQVGGTSYVTGRPGLDYLTLPSFARTNIDLYVQDWAAPVTAHGLSDPSTLQLLAQTGPDVVQKLLSVTGIHRVEEHADRVGPY